MCNFVCLYMSVCWILDSLELELQVDVSNLIKKSGKRIGLLLSHHFGSSVFLLIVFLLFFSVYGACVHAHTLACANMSTRV